MVFGKHLKCFKGEADVCLFGFSAFFALGAFFDFMVHQYMVQFRCLLFSRMFEVRRVVIPGPIAPCQFYLMSLLAIGCFASVATHRARAGTRILSSLCSKIIAILIPVVAFMNYLLLKKGLQSLCDSFDVNKLCESEVFENADFKTFTPKYLDAYSFYNFCVRGKAYCIILSFLWIASVLAHCRRHKRFLVENVISDIVINN